MKCPGLTVHSYWSYEQYSYDGETPLRAWSMFFGFGGRFREPLDKTACGRTLCVRSA